MKYKSKRGTTITIPDGLTDKQIAAIKADADAGYGTRAQETANRLGKEVSAAPATPAPVTAPAPVAAPTPAPAGLSSRQQARLTWLLKNRPNDPQVSQLQAIQSGAAPAQPDTADNSGEPAAEQPATGNGPGEPVTAPAAPALTPRQQARLTWLLKNRPKDPQVKKLQDIQAGAAPNPGDDGAQGDDGGDVVPTPAAPPEAPPISDGIKPNGEIDLDAADATVENSREEDAAAQFKLDNPDEVDEYGNTVTYTRDPVTGQIIRKVTQGDVAKRFTQLATSAAEGYDPAGDRGRAEDATYGTLTKYYDRDKAREIETQKQDLANRGIPYDPAAAQDPNTDNLYGKTIGAVDQKYQGLKDTASQQAVVSGNQAYATTASARDSFLSTVTNSADKFGSSFRDYVNTVQSQSGDDDLLLLSMSAEQIARLRGISVQEATAIRDDATNRYNIKMQEKAAKRADRTANKAIAASNSGGSGGGSGTTKAADPAPGFEIVG